MSGVWAVVPVKCFTRGKSRLDGVLGGEGREELARSLCAHVLGVLREAEVGGGVEGVIVSTDCAMVERFVTGLGARVVRDATVGSLASIVDGAMGAVRARGARAALVLMSDLPLLQVDDVRGLVTALQTSPLVLAPDLRDEGTNALGMSPPAGMQTCFGTVGSFDLHRARATHAALPFTIYRSEGTACDLDSPGDLARVAAQAERGARFKTNLNLSSRVRAA